MAGVVGSYPSVLLLALIDLISVDSTVCPQLDAARIVIIVINVHLKIALLLTLGSNDSLDIDSYLAENIFLISLLLCFLVLLFFAVKI